MATKSVNKDDVIRGTSASTDSGVSPSLKNMKPRGFYAEDTSKYKDQDKEFYKLTPEMCLWFTFKTSLGIITYVMTFSIFSSHLLAFFVFTFAIIIYQDIVVFAANYLKGVAPDKFKYGKLHRMGPMDQTCFLGSKEAHTNYVNCSLQDLPCADAAFHKFQSIYKLFPKLRYKIK